MLGQKTSFICPSCDTEFFLKGRKLRLWLIKKNRNPDIRGPYCNYRCSGKANVQFAIATRREQFLRRVESASSNLVTASDS